MASNHAGTYRKGDTIARGYIDTGDQVFVDKMSYSFIHPGRGDVFVFKTYGIRRIEIGLPPGVQSQHYIKRLAGLPGDVLRINAPYLFVNGREASEWVFERVMSGRNGYRGYSNMQQFPYLSTPEETFKVPEQSYFALGDNSYFSKDSRDFGAVPELNVTGKGLFVYWPFSKRWGLIH
ncbi:MAG: signal peptidase I [Terrimicrobiaceae bacterium]